MNSSTTTLSKNNIIIQRLTALWAFSESGLGGIMFALKIPFTGFFVGGFAVIMLSLIAHFTRHNYKQVLQATAIVILVKAAVSPHSPPPAYLAVAFQGCAAAVLFRYISSHKIACILLGALAMAESALQKIIILTLIFSKKLWEAIDALFMQLSKEFQINVAVDYSLSLIVAYLILYIFWGMIIGNWAAELPLIIDANKIKVMAHFQNKSVSPDLISQRHSKKSKLKTSFIFLLVTVFIIAVFRWQGASEKAIAIIFLRTVAVIVLLFFVVKPLLMQLLLRWISQQNSETKQQTQQIILMMPTIKSYASAAYRMAGLETSSYRKISGFVISLIVLSLYANERE